MNARHFGRIPCRTKEKMADGFSSLGQSHQAIGSNLARSGRNRTKVMHSHIQRQTFGADTDGTLIVSQLSRYTVSTSTINIPLPTQLLSPHGEDSVAMWSKPIGRVCILTHVQDCSSAQLKMILVLPETFVSFTGRENRDWTCLPFSHKYFHPENRSTVSITLLLVAFSFFQVREPYVESQCRLLDFKLGGL
jgi:hypothetical protein